MSCGIEKGDRLSMRIGKKRYLLVCIGHSDFPGYLEVKWSGTRHESKVKTEWVEKLPPRGSHRRV